MQRRAQRVQCASNASAVCCFSAPAVLLAAASSCRTIRIRAFRSAAFCSEHYAAFTLWREEREGEKKRTETCRGVLWNGNLQDVQQKREGGENNTVW